VTVKEIQVLEFCDLDHFAGKGQCIKREVEERITGHLDFMENDVICKSGQAHRKGIAYEMNVVSSLSKSLAEFGGDDAAPAVRWIASDTDVHGRNSLHKVRQNR